MRIAICSDTFLPIVDGVGRVCSNYAHSLGSKGHECYVITPLKKTGYRGSLPFEIIDFVSVKVPSAPQYRTGIAVLDLHYTERISLIELDLIHSHSPGLAGIEALRLADKLNLPLVGTFHSKYYDDLKRVTRSDVLATLGSRFIAEYYENCDEVWTVSEEAAVTLQSYGYNGEIVLMPNGTELRVPSPAEERAARERFQLGKAPILLYVGQIDHKKNLGRILEAAALLASQGLDFQLVFAGQGRDRKDLRAMATRLGLERLVCTGHISDRHLLDGLYMAADLFVFPSLYDTAGLVVQEAAAMGTPSVVVRGTAPAEIITDGVNGLLCEDSPENLCAVIRHYLVEMDPDQRLAMRAETRRSVPLPWKEVMTKVEARYQELILRGRKHSPLLLPWNQEPDQNPPR